MSDGTAWPLTCILDVIINLVVLQTGDSMCLEKLCKKRIPIVKATVYCVFCCSTEAAAPLTTITSINVTTRFITSDPFQTGWPVLQQAGLIHTLHVRHYVLVMRVYSGVTTVMFYTYYSNFKLATNIYSQQGIVGHLTRSATAIVWAHSTVANCKENACDRLIAWSSKTK